jgi:hypothetical protein
MGSANAFKRSKPSTMAPSREGEVWVIFDLDDTLTHCEWRAHHLDKEKNGGRANWNAFFNACGEDPPIEAMLSHALSLQAAGARLAFWTGRPENQQGKTQAWLSRHGLVDFELRMRPGGNFTKDHEMKRKWMEESMAAGRSFACAFDDREANRTAFEAFGVASADPLRPDLVGALVAKALERLAPASRPGSP